MRLEGKVAIITGGGRGIGRAYAERFLHEGAAVVIADINEDEAGRRPATCPVRVVPTFIRTDISDPASVEQTVDRSVDQFGGIDILINNAALYGDWDMRDQSFDYLKRVFDVNLHGQWLMSRAAAPHFVERGGGRIINQASGAAYNYTPTPPDTPFTGLGAFNYGQTKWGVVGLTKFMAAQLGRWGITVNCIAPGVIATEATLRTVPDSLFDTLVARQAVAGRLTADDLTGAAVYFATDEARFVTGQVLVIDGGRHMPA